MSNPDVIDVIKIKSNKKSTISIVLGVLSIVTSIPFMVVGFTLGIIGLIYGVIAKRQINSFKLNGKGKTNIGILCCLLGISLTILFSFNTGQQLFN